MAAQRSDLAVPTHADPDEQDQRGHPRILPACQRCAHSDTAVALRTDYVLYIRCARCAWVWPIPKPGAKPGSGLLADTDDLRKRQK